jgi:diguanylate cyclase (GGDEF)-like protein/PAS domain S-box-containing protein
MKTPREQMRLALALVALGTALVIGLCILIQAQVGHERAEAETRLQRELEAQAHLAEAAVMERVRKIDTAILFLRESLEARGLDEFKRMLASLANSGQLDIATANLVADRNGTVLLSGGRPPQSHVSVSDRDYFTRLGDGEDRLDISGPIAGRISKRTIVVLARRVRSPDGGFAGVVAIGIDPQALIGSGLSRRASGNEILTVMSGDGMVLARSADADTYIGRRIDDAAVATLHSGDAVYAVRASPTDGRMRAHALRHVQGLPLYVAVGDTFEELESRLAPRRTMLWLSGTAIAALLLALLWLAWRYAQRRVAQIGDLGAMQRRLDIIIESLAEGVVVRDAEGRITLVNEAAARLSGVPRSDLIGQRPENAIWDLVDEHGQTLPPDRYPSARTVESGKPIDHQLYGIRTPGRRPAWVSISTRLLDTDPQGSSDVVVATLSEVTRLREAEREGRMAAAVFAQVSQPIVITDGESNILRINRAFTETFGYSVEEAVGRKISILRSQRHEERFYAGIWAALQRDGYWHGEVWNRSRSGEPIPFLASITKINEPASREVRYVAVYSDLHDQKAAEEVLRWQANHDPLTGLPNRPLLLDRIQTAISQAERKKARVAVVFVDLDQFKPINDLHGHLAGDLVLQTVADRMQGVLRASDTLARVGGDEFIAVLGEVGESAGVRRALSGLLAAVREPVAWEDTTLTVGCSIGVAFWPEDASSPAALVEAADAAMYAAKKEGGSRIATAADSETGCDGT